jgi:serine protease
LHNTGQTGGTADADIDASDAWTITTGSAAVVVALLDTGLDLSHPDLAPNLWVNPGETVNGADSDGNGYADDMHG